MCYLAEKLTSYVINNSRYDEAEYNILKYGFQVGIELIICMSVNMLFAIHFHMMEDAYSAKTEHSLHMSGALFR